jgi:hypothetical protein
VVGCLSVVMVRELKVHFKIYRPPKYNSVQFEKKFGETTFFVYLLTNLNGKA